MNSIKKVALAVAVVGASIVAQVQVTKADAYVVQAGESFFSIAQAYHTDPYQLAANNGMNIYSTINPGDVLEVVGYQAQPVVAETVAPAQDSTASYTVQAGDSFASIAAQYGLSADELATLNQLDVSSVLVKGQVLVVSANPTEKAAESVPTDEYDDYKLDGFDYEPGINYPIGQCTWGVQKVTGWAGDWWGNANDWAVNAAKDGYLTGYTPQVGAIAVWDGGEYGHVAYVTDVNADQEIQVLEANYAGQQAINNYRGWFDPTKVQGKVVYIYPRN